MGNTRLKPTLGSIFNHFTNSGWWTGTLQEVKDLFDVSSSDLYRNEFTTQYESPVSGATVQVTDSSANIFMLVTPAGSIATLIVKMPAVANVVDKQEVKFWFSSIVSSFTIDSNGASNTLGEPNSFAANTYFTLRYDSQNNIWYRVG